MKKLYICVMNSGRLTGEIVRLFARKSDYSHVGFSFCKELNPLYSFGRLNWYSPFPGGFIMQGFGTKFYNHNPKGRLRLFTADITDWQNDLINSKLAPFLLAPRSYKYDYLNIMAHLIKQPCKREKNYICTSFCGELLGSVIGLRKTPSLLTPQDFAELNLKIEYEGSFKSYPFVKAVPNGDNTK